LRYGRPTWPDAFVGRIRKAVPLLKGVLEPLKNDIAEVRVAIAEQDKELAANQSYNLLLYFVVDGETWDEDPVGRQAVVQAFVAFRAALQACDGVEVSEESDVYSGHDLTWQQTRSTDEWNFANLSQAD
jgi:hypothetical protein